MPVVLHQEQGEMNPMLLKKKNPIISAIKERQEERKLIEQEENEAQEEERRLLAIEEAHEKRMLSIDNKKAEVMITEMLAEHPEDTILQRELRKEQAHLLQAIRDKRPDASFKELLMAFTEVSAQLNKRDLKEDDEIKSSRVVMVNIIMPDKQIRNIAVNDMHVVDINNEGV